MASYTEGRISTPYEVFRSDGLSLLKAEVSPVRDRENEFYRSLADWVVGSGAKEVALVGGLDESLRADESSYKVAMTSRFATSGGLPGEPTLEDDKMIVGPVASLLNIFEMKGFPAYAVLAFVTMPFLVFVVPRIYWSLHPDTIIGATGKLKLQMESRMLQGLFGSLVGFTGLFVWLYTLEVRLARLSLARRAREEA